ncbi:hypothetical protein [Bordetella sp. H567]|nr:hypothetical protein [Bordetella sp. H567]
MSLSLPYSISIYFEVKTNVVGSFPGSPVQLDHVFSLVADKIQSLRIE